MQKRILTVMLAAVSAKVAKAQKFQGGDRVIVANLPSYMSHFSSGPATVLYSYAQMYAQTDVEQANQYCLMFDTGHTSSWYPASVMTKID